MPYVKQNIEQAAPANHYTIGINDDVTHRSLAVGKEINIIPSSTYSFKFWSLGSDGTVGANKNTIKIIGDHTDKYVQAYFEYDGKKSGGVTKSHLRFGDTPIRSSYLVRHADFVACHNKAYVQNYDLISDLKPEGSFLLACDWKTVEELDAHLPAAMRRAIAQKHIRFYVIDSVSIAAELKAIDQYHPPGGFLPHYRDHPEQSGSAVYERSCAEELRPQRGKGREHELCGS